jgi:hypothetical protein
MMTEEELHCLREENRRLRETVSLQQEQIALQEHELAILKQQLQRIQDRLKKDSHNSHLRPPRIAFIGKKPCGQSDHAGNILVLSQRKCQNAGQGVVTNGIYPHSSHKKATQCSHFPHSSLTLEAISPLLASFPLSCSEFWHFLLVNFRQLRNPAHQRFRLMGIQLVTNDMPPADLGVRGDDSLQVRQEIHFGSTGATTGSQKFSRDHIAAQDKRAGSMTHILKFSPLDLAWS